MKKCYLVIIVGFVCCLFFAYMTTIDAKAAPHKYHDLVNDTEINYDNTEVKYQYNAADVNMNDIGIIGDSGSALAPISDLFVRSMNIDCEFKLSDLSVTLRDGDNSVKITQGKKKAVVNGKKVEMSEKAKVLRNQQDTHLLYVPTRFVASQLGFDYLWDSTLSTVFISKDESIYYKSDFDETPILLPVNPDVKTEDILVTDDYLNNQIIVYIPGNYVDTYKNDCIINHYSGINDIELSLSSNNETILCFNTSKIMVCSPQVEDNVLSLAFLSPKDVYKNIVVLDAGHGGYDPGAVRDDIHESKINLAIVYNYTKDLFEQSDIKVYYTRTTDTFVELNDRAKFASKVGADCFVSLHQNTYSDPKIKGLSVYHSSLNTNKGVSGLTGKKMADFFVERMCSKLEMKKIGRIDQPLTVTTHNSVPAVLIELGFMSNPDELARLSDPEFQKKAGQALFDTIVQLFDEYPTKR